MEDESLHHRHKSPLLNPYPGSFHFSKVRFIITLQLSPLQNWGSSVSIVSDYRQDERGSIPGRGKIFFSILSVQTSSGSHPASYPMGIVGKSRSGPDANYSPPSSAKVKNEYQLHSSPPPWRLHGGNGTALLLWDFGFSRRRIWSSESSGIYFRVVKSMSTDISEELCFYLWPIFPGGIDNKMFGSNSVCMNSPLPLWGLPHSLQLGPWQVHSPQLITVVAIGRLSYMSQPITARFPCRLRPSHSQPARYSGLYHWLAASYSTSL
jgi:hypothetical protein